MTQSPRNVILHFYCLLPFFLPVLWNKQFLYIAAICYAGNIICLCQQSSVFITKTFLGVLQTAYYAFAVICRWLK